MNQQRWRQIVSGRAEGRVPAAARLGLGIAAAGYATAVAARNCLYDRKMLAVYKPPVPVISVGNITAGGTGKTPLVIRLYETLKERHRPAILTRGYRAAGGRSDPRPGTGRKNVDEPALLEKACPAAAVVVDADRAAGARRAVEEFGAEVLLLDDGFQHRRIFRDLDIVVIDSTCPFGYGRLLPAGLLRETAGSLARADAVVLTRCDQAADAELDRIEGRLTRIKPDLPIARSIHEPTSLVVARHSEVERHPARFLGGRKVFAFCGIGNPGSFLACLRSLGTVVAGSRVFDDHHRYTAADLADIRRAAGELSAEMAVTTQKDFTKIPQPEGPPGGVPIACLEVRLRITSGGHDLTRLIEKALAGRIGAR
jgi:tetraacyldisaccharide 4'-kinase